MNYKSQPSFEDKYESISFGNITAVDSNNLSNNMNSIFFLNQFPNLYKTLDSDTINEKYVSLFTFLNANKNEAELILSKCSTELFESYLNILQSCETLFIKKICLSILSIYSSSQISVPFWKKHYSFVLYVLQQVSIPNPIFTRFFLTFYTNFLYHHLVLDPELVPFTAITSLITIEFEDKENTINLWIKSIAMRFNACSSFGQKIDSTSFNLVYSSIFDHIDYILLHENIIETLVRFFYDTLTEAQISAEDFSKYKILELNQQILINYQNPNILAYVIANMGLIIKYNLGHSTYDSNDFIFYAIGCIDFTEIYVASLFAAEQYYYSTDFQEDSLELLIGDLFDKSYYLEADHEKYPRNYSSFMEFLIKQDKNTTEKISLLLFVCHLINHFGTLIHDSEIIDSGISDFVFDSFSAVFGEDDFLTVIETLNCLCDKLKISAMEFLRGKVDEYSVIDNLQEIIDNCSDSDQVYELSNSCFQNYKTLFK